MSSFGKITSTTVHDLSTQYTFEIIPDCPAATAAGYTAATRATAQIWYPPVYSSDGSRFFYGGWHGNAADPTHLSTILCCRNAADGSLVWAVNCRDYDLDIAPNLLGDTSTVARVQPFVLDNTLYVCRANVSNIGPQLFAVNTTDGSLRWAAAYYPPDGAPPFITTKGNYAALIGSNMRLGDLAPVAAHVNVNGVSKKYVFVGSSSQQNAFNLNYALFGFPRYTDQGFLFCIEDQGTTAAPVWRAPTCAPLLKVGDTIVKGGNPIYDPFQPTQTQTVLYSLSSGTNNFVQPYFIPVPPAPGLPNTCPLAAVVNFDSTTVINASLVQPLWGLVGKTIYQDINRTTPNNLAGLLTKWTAEQAALPAGGSVRHVIWTYVNAATMTSIKAQPGNEHVLYFKYLTSGQTITEDSDAQGLNYWGNSTWGARPKLDLERNLIYFTTGQAHALPLSEALFYQDPAYNFYNLKVPVVDAINKYIAGTATLNTVNKAKRTFLTLISDLSLNVRDKSPRGRMSYSDSVMGAYIQPYTTRSGTVVPGGTVAFGLRVVPYDSYTFLDSPQAAVYPLNALDGDVSSGVEMFVDCDSSSSGDSSSSDDDLGSSSGDENVYLCVSTKNGLIPIVDVSDINPNVVFDHNNLNRKGVFLTRLVFGGPNASAGGSTYQNASSGNLFYSIQCNVSFIDDGARGSDGGLESHVTSDGRVFFPGDSFVECFQVPSGTFKWETNLGETNNTEIVTQSGVVYVGALGGTLRALSAKTGAVLWSFNGPSIGLNGGINGPAISADSKQVLWINNYFTTGTGSAGPNGASFRVPA